MSVAVMEAAVNGHGASEVIPTGISPQYVKGWGIDKAIREVLQNWLDSKTEFRCRGSIEHRNGKAIVRDFGPGLEMRHLALGISEKTNKSIGKYGEGLKLAFLVFARERRPIRLRARGKIVTPTIRFDPSYQTDVMYLTVEPDPRPIRGTMVEFDCSEEELHAGKSCFQAFGTEVNFDWLVPGRMSLPGGFIYVNGARVGKLDKAMFSYHLEEEQVGNIGNRDREVVDINAVSGHIRNIMASPGLKGMEMMLRGITENTSWETAHAPAVNYSNTKVWKGVFRRVFGNMAVLHDIHGSSFSTTQDNSEAGYRGYRVVTLPWQWFSFLSSCKVPTAKEAMDAEVSPTRAVPRNKLTDIERTNLDRATVLVTNNYGNPESVVISETLDRRKVEYGGWTNGMWNPKTQTIYLHRRVLSTLESAVNTLLHETVHKNTGYGDCSPLFEKELCETAARLLVRGVR